MVDMAIVGHIGDARYIGAVAIGSMIFNVICWLFGFLRMGSSGMTAQAFGADDKAEMLRVLLRSLGVGLVIGTFFVIFQWVIIPLGMALMHPDADVRPLAETYCYIVIWGLPAMMGLYGFSGWFTGMQNTRITMVVSILQNIINIILSLLFVFAFHWSIAGVAAGTVVAQWSGFFMYGYAALRSHGKTLLPYLDVRGVFQRKALKRFFTVNRDIFVRTLFLITVTLSFTAMGSRQGSVVLSANTLLIYFFTLFSYFMDGFAFAAEGLCGRYYGAGDIGSLRLTVRNLIGWGIGLMIVFTAFYIFGGQLLLSLLTDDTTVLTYTKRYIYWAAAIPATGVMAFIFDGVFVGLTRTRVMLLSAFSGAAVFFLIFFVLYPFLGNHALWLALNLFLFMRGAAEVLAYRLIQF